MDCQSVMEFINREHTFTRHSGVTVTQVSLQRAEARLEIAPEHLNPGGNLHGGMYFTLADAAATALCMADGRRYVTADSDIRFLRGVSQGIVLAEAMPIHRGRRSCVVRVDLTTPEGKHLAAFTGSFSCVERNGTEVPV